MLGLLVIVTAMVVCLAVAGLVVTYVAYPHRGEELPRAAWLGHALGRTVDRVPRLDRD